MKEAAVAASSLADNKCVPCRGGTPPLTHEQIAPLLAQLVGWQVENDTKLSKSFKVKDWVAAVDFVNRISPVAEAEGQDRKSTRLNSSHDQISYAVFCL